MAWSDDLDPNSQAYEIAASNSKKIRVLAGPGTGKSFAMKRRVGRLLEAGVSPSKILPVTFTRVAAEDLHRELVSMNIPGCENIEGITLHSLGFKILSRNNVFTVTGRVPRPLNEFELAALLNDLKESNGGIRNVKEKIKAFAAAWARLQADNPGFSDSPEDQRFSSDLMQWLTFHRSMLIDEIIPETYRFLRDNPNAPERQEFSHILVDEYQDLNKAEQGVIEGLGQDSEICIVGDDDQSIYSFKHAHPEGIREWIENNAPAMDVTLDLCRRCPVKVTQIANHLIRCNQDRPGLRALSPMPSNGEGKVEIIQYDGLEDEIEGVVNKIKDLTDSGVQPGEILVLAPRKIIGTPIYDGLKSHGVPVKSYYAESELEREVKWSRKSGHVVKVYREPMKGIRHGKTTFIHGSVQSEGRA